MSPGGTRARGGGALRDGASARPRLYGRGPGPARQDGATSPCLYFSRRSVRQGREPSYGWAWAWRRPESSPSWLEPSDTRIHVSAQPIIRMTLLHLRVCNKHLCNKDLLVNHELSLRCESTQAPRTYRGIGVKIKADKTIFRAFRLCQLNKLVGGGVYPPKDVWQGGSGSSTSSLAIAIVISSARIGLELIGDCHANISIM